MGEGPNIALRWLRRYQGGPVQPGNVGELQANGDGDCIPLHDWPRRQFCWYGQHG